MQYNTALFAIDTIWLREQAGCVLTFERETPCACPLVAAVILVVALTACSREVPSVAGADAAGFSAPTPATVAAVLAEAAKAIADRRWRGSAGGRARFIAREQALTVHVGDGKLWCTSASGYDFTQGNYPESVHPGLWRQAKLNSLHGLYKVTDGIYQVRGYDLAVMSIIEEQEWLDCGGSSYVA
jgi:alkyl sulfatase BDS1-like metallo-beta-lactamase superfamily hydrolase